MAFYLIISVNIFPMKKLKIKGVLGKGNFTGRRGKTIFWECYSLYWWCKGKHVLFQQRAKNLS